MYVLQSSVFYTLHVSPWRGAGRVGSGRRRVTALEGKKEEEEKAYLTWNLLQSVRLYSPVSLIFVHL